MEWWTMLQQAPWRFCLVMTVAAIVLLTNLGQPRLWDRDEPRNAGCAREMLERGDWVTPMFNAELRTAKPVLLYWLIMASYSVFGITEFAARLPSAMLGLMTVAAIFVTARRLFNAQVAMWSGLILTTTLMFNVASHAATPDAPLLCCVTVSIMFFVLFAFPNQNSPTDKTEAKPLFPKQWLAALAIYGVMGIGVLAKGPVALILPTAIIGMYLLVRQVPQSNSTQSLNVKSLTTAKGRTLWQRIGLVLGVLIAALFIEQVGGVKMVVLCGAIVIATIALVDRRDLLTWLQPFQPKRFLATCWMMRPLTAIGVALCIAAPWYIWVGLRTDGEFLRVFFLKEHFGRATTAMENHNGSLLFYPTSILAGFFPWSVFAAPIVVDLVRRWKSTDDQQHESKQNTTESWRNGYLLATCWICVWVGVFSLASTKLPSYITPCYPAIALLAGCFIHRLTGGELLSSRFVQRLAYGSLATVALIMLIGGPFLLAAFLPGSQWLALLGVTPLIVACMSAFFFETGRWKRSAFVFSWGAFAVIFSSFAMGLGEVSKHRASHDLVADATERSVPLASYGVLEPSWVFYHGKPFPFFSHGKLKETQAFLKSDPQAVVIMTENDFNNVKKKLPADTVPIATSDYFLQDERLVLVGRKTQPLVATGEESSSLR